MSQAKDNIYDPLTYDSEPPFNPNPTKVTRRLFHARHHLLLSHLLSLIPTLPNIIQPLLVRLFPHKRESEVAQTTWVRNICEMIGYCPELGGRVWGGIVDRMLRIDVSRNSGLRLMIIRSKSPTSRKRMMKMRTTMKKRTEMTSKLYRVRPSRSTLLIS